MARSPKRDKPQPSAGRRRAYRSGRAGEFLAALRLMLVGYRILARRYRTRLGEIDLVAMRGSVLVFIEVKRRPDLQSGLDAVTSLSRQRIRRAAEVFLATHPALSQLSLRFDVIVITPWAWPHHIIGAWRDS